METQATNLQPLQCQNCGAPLDLGANNCQYCHTPYVYPLPTENLDLNFDKPSLGVHLDHGKLELTMGTGSVFSAIRCPHCGNTVPASQFCPKCGHALPEGITCPHCGKLSKFGLHCSHCGKALGRVVDVKKLEWRNPGDIAQMLAGNSAGIWPADSAWSLADQVKEIALGLLAQSGHNADFDIREGHDGALEFILNGQSYAAVQDIPDLNVRNVIQQAVAEWQKQN